MDLLNHAYERTLAAGQLTVGLMTPLGRKPGEMADIESELRLAARADALQFAALWARDVPLMIPQGSTMEAAALDDPFVWLSFLAGVTRSIALGTAAAVLPLRHPIHLAKSALSLDRLSQGRFILGLGSGDREAEFAAFGLDPEQRAEAFRTRWAIVRAALSPSQADRAALLSATDGYDLAVPPAARVPMMAVGSARQTLQWIAAHADAWATYHREEVRQQGRIGLWQSALRERSPGMPKPFVQSIHLDLVDDPSTEAVPIELGLRTGRWALIDYLKRLEANGVAHAMLHLAPGPRPLLGVVEELGMAVLPALRQ
ncbi:MULTISPECIES: TIGR03571 family LLM class oxidoreductase [Cupriavidus]|uniref:TIGR03571 family LLM class oxidoreductase n=1 Tax=Cupriavidus basilensis TaxID=68895 RepID=A0A643G0Q6_9BURK|nr:MULTISPECIES: TIGR03571 family LLM class oxidoreductase [Cupriavidus]KUE88023.1 luciferase [Cupriavidus necator]NOV23799.1 TIGR03571 family LLM class oxidoreductase [Cupriavidus necator]QOT81847.1 TIGR03571 family LLM class oxidoreductase [Cupriavidus basilensis]BDB30293.1 TIGR03571 family LLM class oxidoreductase [Cupriavidus sp. P-10]